MVTNEMKKRILKAIENEASNYSSSAKQAIALGINSAQLSRIKKGEFDRVVSDAKWIGMARRLGVEMSASTKWVTARTPVFDYINNQLAACQSRALSGLLCDIPDIGKTHTAKIYVRKHKNAVYVDCSQTKSKQQFVRRIAREFGVGHTGKYSDVYEDLVYYIRSIETPLVVLDEVGDLHYPGFLGT